MNTLYTTFESLFDDNVDELTEKAALHIVQQFIKDNYNVKNLKISDKPNENGKYLVDAKYVKVTNRFNLKHLCNEFFEWNIVEDWFECRDCDELESLEGAPKMVRGNFLCSGCNKLKTLEGAPELVSYNFNCIGCCGLESLEGAPKKIGDSLNCSGCKKLKTLKGAPKRIGKYLNCYECDSLKSLDGAPREIRDKIRSDIS